VRHEHRLELLHLAAPDVGGRVRTVELLGERADDERARGVREPLEFLEVLGDVMARVGALDGRADEDGALLGRGELDQGADGRSEERGKGARGPGEVPRTG
jgi:hypothetical protein